MDDQFAALRRQLVETQQLVERERQRAEQAQQAEGRERRRAEQERQRAEQERQRAEQERQRAELLEDRLRPTTLLEYIKAFHELVFSKFQVETNKSLTSKGTITNPQRKLCPARLAPWSEFFDHQKEIFGTLYSISSTPTFENRTILEGIGERVSRKKIANEKDLEFVQHLSVEDPVSVIVNHLGAEDEVSNTFKIGGGIVFENHPAAISENAEEVQERQTGPDQNQLRPDQICVYKNSPGSETRSIAYIIEYKAPHKLTLPHLRLGLRPMDIYKDVVNRSTRPTSDEAELRFQYDADRLAAAAITQTFHYMIECGVEYSILTTGEAYVFLKIDWADPTVLYYHLAEPGPEALAHPNDVECCAAVGQVLAFSLTALRSRSKDQAERESATRRLNRWIKDYEVILREIPPSELKAPPSSVGYKPRTYTNVDRSPYQTRSKKLKLRMDSSDNNIADRHQTPESSDDDERHQRLDSPSTAPAIRHDRRAKQRRQDERRIKSVQQEQPRDDSENSSPQYQYCTQECLLGLVRGARLDKQCPNVALHQQRTGSDFHPVSHTQWLQLLKEQLEQTLDEGIVRLGMEGARGVLFQVTLLCYGYTFVSKGTVPVFVGDLEHEAKVYNRLQPLQGTCVPVFLGAIDLRDISKTYYYDLGVRVIYMMFLSWGGQRLNDVVVVDDKKIVQDVLNLLRMLHSQGVVHMDVREPNILWNQKTKRVMLIDFERAELMEDPRRPLAQIVSNKRAHTQATIDCGKAQSRLYSRAKSQVSEDISAARALFR